MAQRKTTDQVNIDAYFTLDIACLLLYVTPVCSNTPVVLHARAPSDEPVSLVALGFVLAAVALVLCVYMSVSLC